MRVIFCAGCADLHPGLYYNPCPSSELLLGQKMSVQPFLHSWSSQTRTHAHMHTRTHAHTHLCSFTTGCLLVNRSHTGVRVPKEKAFPPSQLPHSVPYGGPLLLKCVVLLKAPPRPIHRQCLVTLTPLLSMMSGIFHLCKLYSNIECTCLFCI